MYEAIDLRVGSVVSARVRVRVGVRVGGLRFGLGSRVRVRVEEYGKG